MIDLSLNEVENLSTKAARGTGFSWGLAEDIGKAARRLAQAGMPWPEAILGLKADRDGPALSAEASARVIAASQGRTLCPIRSAVWLLDADVLPDRAALRIDNLASPIWLAALLSLGDAGHPLRMTWPKAEVTIHETGLTFSGEQILVDHSDVMITSLQFVSFWPAPRRRAFISKAALDSLEAIAARTYVPASAASRSKGAGGSRTDDE